MSILAATTPTTAPATLETAPEATFGMILVLLLLTALSPLTAWATGFFRRPGVAGPQRLGPGDTLLRFLFLLLLALMALVVGANLAYPLLRFLPGLQRELAAGMLATAFALVILLLFNDIVRPDGLKRMGLTAPNILHGLLSGLAGLLVIFPWVFWIMLAAQALLKALNTHVETEHPIFELWQQPQTRSSFRLLSYLTAVLLAPVWEELVFRGLLQTALARLFTPAALRTDLRTLSAPPPQPPPQPAPLLLPTPRARWLAILTTSLLFALIHTPWFIQLPIFVLSVALGYLYERTGNLWSVIFMHMLFNGFEFTLFLLAISK